MLLTLGVALIQLTAAADASPVVILESKVAQYKAAAAGVQKALPTAVQVDLEDPKLDTALAAAPLAVAVGRKAFEAVRAKTDKPLVFCMILGASSADVARSITGVPMAPDPGGVLEKIHALLPKAVKVGLIHGPKDLFLQQLHRAASAQGFQLEEKLVNASTDVRDALEDLGTGVDLLYLPPDPKLFGKELLTYILGVAAERKLPVIGFLDSLTQAGALASVAPDYAENGERAGRLAAEILEHSEAKRLPVPGPVFAPGQLSLNLKTARVLGVTVPTALQTGAQVVQ